MKHLILILLTFFSIQMMGQQTFTLDQAIDFALKNSDQMAKAKIDEELIEAQKKEIRGIGLPQIDGSIDVKDFIEIPTSLIPGEFFGGQPGQFIPVQFGTQWNADAGFSASQILFSGDYIVALQSSIEFVNLTRKNTVRTEIDVIENVTKAFYNLLINEERMTLIDANLDQLSNLLKNTQGLYDEGFVEKLDLDRIQVAHNNTLAEKEKMKQLVELSENLLKFQMSMDYNTDIIATGDLSSYNYSVTDSTSIDFNKRIEWSLMESQRSIAELAIKRDKFASLPNLVAYGSYTAQAQRNEFDFLDSQLPWFRVGVVGAKLSVPLFSGFQKKYKLEQSKLELTKLDHDSEMLKSGIELEIRNAQIMLSNSLTTVEIQKKNMSLAQDIYDTVGKKYEEGIGSNIEVIEAETALKTAQNNYYTALFDAIIANIDLKKAKGILTK